MGAGADYDDVIEHGCCRPSTFGGQHEYAAFDVEVHVSDRKVGRFEGLTERNVIAVARAGKNVAHDTNAGTAVGKATPKSGMPARNGASFAVARKRGTGSSSLKAEVNAFDRLHIVRGRNSSYSGSK